MTRHLDLDNPTDEQRLAVQLYERACLDRDNLCDELSRLKQQHAETAVALALAEKELHLNRIALAHAVGNVGRIERAEAALRRIAAQVDLTDPRDPVGAAMTRAGCPDVEYGPDDVDALLAMEPTETSA